MAPQNSSKISPQQSRGLMEITSLVQSQHQMLQKNKSNAQDIYQVNVKVNKWLEENWDKGYLAINHLAQIMQQQIVNKDQ